MQGGRRRPGRCAGRWAAGRQGEQQGCQDASKGKGQQGQHDKGIPLPYLPTYHIEQSKGSMAGMGMAYSNQSGSAAGRAPMGKGGRLADRGQRRAPCSVRLPLLHPWTCAWACSLARVLLPWRPGWRHHG